MFGTKKLNKGCSFSTCWNYHPLVKHLASQNVDKTIPNTGLGRSWTRPLNINAQNSHVEVAKTSRVSEQWPTDQLAVILWTSRGRHGEEDALIGALEKVRADVSYSPPVHSGTVTAHRLRSEATWSKTCFVIAQNVHAGMELWCVERSFGPRDYSRLSLTSGNAERQTQTAKLFQKRSENVRCVKRESRRSQATIMILKTCREDQRAGPTAAVKSH